MYTTGLLKFSSESIAWHLVRNDVVIFSVEQRRNDESTA